MTTPQTDAATRLSTALAGRYAIEREIGAGGMATVYLARDLRHGRRVAIKTMRPEVAAVLGAERFLREIHIAAQLQHPHILPLFDSGAVGDVLYYVMPFVEGESLRERLTRERQLPVEEALHLTREIADALAHAHSLGVIHRDVKPENVLLAGGHALVADFGIAVAAGTAGSGRMTGTGISLGTPSYMSPEQAMAEPHLDGRSDQYSLACVLFEMLAGDPPWGEEPTGPAMLARRLTEPAPGLRSVRASVPDRVEAAIRRALAREPADRYVTVTAFADALGSDSVRNAGKRSVAVLPFQNLSADPDNEYFADGITEDVIAQLARIKALDVISRTSVMRFKGRPASLREIAATLQVSTVLEGSVRRAGDRVRIVAQLIDAGTDQHLWAETYDRQLTDIFAIQSEVALQIAAALEAELSPAEQARIEREPTRDLKAYQLYLLGRHHYISYSEAGIREAIRCFGEAIALDPHYALAYAATGMGWIELTEMGLVNPAEASPRAKEAAARAIALGPELGEAHCAVALARLVHDQDWAGAEAEFKRALELSPGSAEAHDLYGRFCSAMGRFDEAITLQQRAHRLDPLAHPVDVANALLRAGRPDEAVEAARRAVALVPGQPRAHATLGFALIHAGSIEQGLASLEHAVAMAPADPLWLAQLGEAYGLAQQHQRARAILAQLESQSQSRYVSPYHFAYVHTGLGQYDRAMDYLEEAFAQRAGAVYGIRGSFLFAPLRPHPRFAALVRRMGLG